jgi:hypothetical protein
MYMLILNFTYPLRCLRVPLGVRVPPVEYHCSSGYHRMSTDVSLGLTTTHTTARHYSFSRSTGFKLLRSLTWLRNSKYLPTYLPNCLSHFNTLHSECERKYVDLHVTGYKRLSTINAIKNFKTILKSNLT